MEIRLHGRGGQGGVTCAKIIASAYARLGKQVQAFGDYAGERSGAPVRAYTRVSDVEITNLTLVGSPSLIGLLVNSGVANVEATVNVDTLDVTQPVNVNAFVDIVKDNVNINLNDDFQEADDGDLCFALENIFN